MNVILLVGLCAAVIASGLGFAALTADRATDRSLGDLLSLPVAASETIYAGSLVCVDTDGYAVAAADTSGYIFMGVATEQADNSGGSDGDVHVTVYRRGRFRFGWQGYGLTQAAVGDLAYVVDDQTLDAPDDTTNDVLVGQITKIEGTDEVWVDIDEGCRHGGGDWTEPTTTTAGA
ncbi:MAG: hypothetical protein ACODAJ_09090 [Planctomycetota bacterium]